MRLEFSKATKRIIASRAGNQCSYIGCLIRTVGPDVTTGTLLQAGVAAHIYSASPQGPRGQGGLNSKELMHHENGIWLCAKHSVLIDANNGVGHPAEKLFSYKRLHEHRVQKELLGVSPTIGWIDEFEILQSPLFEPCAKVKLGKLNLLFGDNAVGKTTFGRFLGGIFDINKLKHWFAPGENDLDFQIKYFNPDPISIKLSISKDFPIRYEINGLASSRIPISCHVVTVPEFDEPYEVNDKAYISRILNYPEWEITDLAKAINAYPHSHLVNYRFENNEEYEGITLRVNLRDTEYPERVFQNLATTEKKLVFIDFAMAAARKSSKMEPTLLVLDCNFMDGVKHFEKLANQLLAPENNFQTILTMRINGININDVQWRGWEVIRLYREGNSQTMFSQDPKMNIAHVPWILKPRKKSRDAL